MEKCGGFYKSGFGKPVDLKDVNPKDSCDGHFMISQVLI
jgi:hypothetical protein